MISYLYGKIDLWQAYRTVISSKGQVVIPAELREEFGLEKGTPATWTEEKGRLVLTPITVTATARNQGISEAGSGRAVGFRRFV